MSQALPLREQMRALENLQELDLRIDSLKKKRDSLPAALKALEDSLTKTKQIFEARKNAVAELEKTKRQTHAGLELNKDRLTRSMGRLEQIKNSQEFQAVNKEIDQLKKLNTQLEEQLKKSDTDIAAAAAELTKLEGELGTVQSQYDSQQTEVSGEKGQIETQITQFIAERTQYTTKVERPTLSLYDRVRAARGGLGCVPALGGRCKGCNMMVPPQLYNEIQRASNLHSCPSCNRILLVASSQQGSSSDNPASAVNS